jgi:cellulose biosynthesis protein BcsQ
MDLLNTEICQRVAYIDAMTSGVSVMQYAPSSKAANEIESLCDELTLQEAEEEPITQEPYAYTEPHDVYGEKPSW